MPPLVSTRRGEALHGRDQSAESSLRDHRSFRRLVTGAKPGICSALQRPAATWVPRGVVVRWGAEAFGDAQAGSLGSSAPLPGTGSSSVGSAFGSTSGSLGRPVPGSSLPGSWGVVVIANLPSSRGTYEVAPRATGVERDAVPRESSEVSARSVRASPGRLNPEWAEGHRPSSPGGV
jgi:hypothetical protein